MSDFIKLLLYILSGMLIFAWAVRCRIKKWNDMRTKRRKKELFKRIRKAVNSGDDNPVYQKIVDDYDRFGSIEAALNANPLSTEEVALLLPERKKMSVDALGFKNSLKLLCRCIAALLAAVIAYQCMESNRNKDYFHILIIVIGSYQIGYLLLLVGLQMVMDRKNKGC